MASKATASGAACNFVRGPSPSYSWDQPSSGGVRGWEGRCGQTCVANLLKNTRPSVHVSPQTLINDGGSDITPGSLPSTLLAMLNRRSRRRRYAIVNERRRIAQAHPHRPIGCLLQWNSKSLHWVTVVGSRATNVVFNHWGRQQWLSRDEFDRRWGFKDQGTSDWLITILGQLSPYTSLA